MQFLRFVKTLWNSLITGIRHFYICWCLQWTFYWHSSLPECALFVACLTVS